MPTEVTEQETAQKLEDLLSSNEPENVSEGKDEQPETPEATKEPVVKEEKPDPKFEARVQAEADKRANSYRETRESDTAVIRKLTADLTEARKAGREKKTSSLISTILRGEVEEGNLTEEEAKTKEQALKELTQKYDKNSDEVEEAAQAVSTIMAKIPKPVIEKYGLSDPNPNVRAVNISNLISDVAGYINHNQDFLMAIEQFLPKGDELRTQLEAMVEGMAEFDSEKAKKLYLADKVKGLKTPIRKKPPTPSGDSGVVDLSKLSARELFLLGEKSKK